MKNLRTTSVSQNLLSYKKKARSSLSKWRLKIKERTLLRLIACCGCFTEEKRNKRKSKAQILGSENISEERSQKIWEPIIGYYT